MSKARDVASVVRLAEVLMRVAPLLEKYNLRVGQFIDNACVDGGDLSLFYAENGRLAERLTEYATRLEAGSTSAPS